MCDTFSRLATDVLREMRTTDKAIADAMAIGTRAYGVIGRIVDSGSIRLAKTFKRYDTTPDEFLAELEKRTSPEWVYEMGYLAAEMLTR